MKKRKKRGVRSLLTVHFTESSLMQRPGSTAEATCGWPSGSVPTSQASSVAGVLHALSTSGVRSRGFAAPAARHRPRCWNAEAAEAAEPPSLEVAPTAAMMAEDATAAKATSAIVSAAFVARTSARAAADTAVAPTELKSKLRLAPDFEMPTSYRRV